MLEAPYYKKVENIISPDFTEFLYSYLWDLSKHSTLQLGELNVELDQDEKPMNIFEWYGDFAYDVLLRRLHKRMEEETGVSLIPTYSFCRLYGNNAILYPHTDRPSCEYSMSLKLGDNGKGNWPLVMEGTEVYLNPGDAVVYKGCELEHWRDRCTIKGYKSGHVFLHYVEADGEYASFAYDRNEYRKQLFNVTLEEIVGEWNL